MENSMNYILVNYSGEKGLVTDNLQEALHIILNYEYKLIAYAEKSIDVEEAVDYAINGGNY